MTLQEFFTRHPRLALGLSGGVDSAYLLAEAVRCGCWIQPYFVDSPFQPRFELEHARRLCEEQGVELKVLPPSRWRTKTCGRTVRCVAITAKSRCSERFWPLQSGRLRRRLSTEPMPRMMHPTAPACGRWKRCGSTVRCGCAA